MSKYSGTSRYYQPQPNNVINYNPYLNMPPSHLAPTYTAYQAHTPYRLAPVETKPASNYFIPSFTTSMASSNSFLIDKRRILLRNVTYSIYKE